MKFRIGYGFDVHRMEPGEEFWLGGIKIDYHLGPAGHSDADVLIHVICDALLGAANLGDIGFRFPDTDPDLKGIDSKILLKKVVELLGENDFKIGNIDSTVCLERPKINPHIPEMKRCLAEVMSIPERDLSIKATTTEKLGFVGREAGIAAHAIALIYAAS